LKFETGGFAGISNRLPGRADSKGLKELRVDFVQVLILKG